MSVTIKTVATMVFIIVSDSRSRLKSIIRSGKIVVFKRFRDKINRSIFRSVLVVGSLFMLIGCAEDRITQGHAGITQGHGGGWIISTDEVADGGPGKDGIPALINTPMISVDAVDYLADEALVVGYLSGSSIHAFPHALLDWHEIANATVGTVKVAITYCPLTGSALAWNRILNGNETTFGVSGLLYRNNLMPYDRASETYWSQLRMDAVHGDLVETRAEVFQVLETTWATWRKIYPESMVASDLTGVYPQSQYQLYPYGNYRETSFTIQEISEIDNRLFLKERVGGVVTNNLAKVYRFGSFADSIGVIVDSFQGDSLVIVGSQTDNFMMIFNRKFQGGPALTFTALQNELPTVMIDNEGTKWDLFGRGVDGKRTGQQLAHPTTYIAYWFAWTQFYPNTLIFEDEEYSMELSPLSLF